MSKEARHAAPEAGKATSATSSDIRDDLAALRDDVTRLGSQIVEILGARGDTAWRSVKSDVESVLSDAQGKGAEAVGAVREVGDAFGGAIDESLKRRPYTTLALAAGIGFIFGATWRH